MVDLSGQAPQNFFGFIRRRDWPALFGYLLFIGMMAVGYYYNVAFIQLGLLDLGQRLIGMTRLQVAAQMAALALVTSLVSLVVGFTMQRRGWSTNFFLKLRLAWVVVAAQTLLTFIAPFLRSSAAFSGWILLAAVALGVGVPVTFGLTVDLIPRRDRGMVAAAITALAYFAAPIFSYPWRIEHLSRQMLFVMAPGLLALAGLAFWQNALTAKLARQHRQPAFYYGRFLQSGPGKRVRPRRRVYIWVVLMFGVFFIDSLGFVRMTETPALMQGAWQAIELGPRLTIAVVHVLAAGVAGVLYTVFDERELFLWVFGLFGLVHLLYTFPFTFGASNSQGLSQPIVYAVAVSLYTVLNFALWADISTARTISRNAALGVALSAWSATFISTALALVFQTAGMSLTLHLRIVDALAALFFVSMLIVTFFRTAERQPQETSAS
ncbi:MAG TPA: hypothetical protein VLS48_00015 [Anaerolineales bacterium]|nr:hypothetical protein [Anaerolineales bacterium]